MLKEKKKNRIMGQIIVNEDGEVPRHKWTKGRKWGWQKWTQCERHPCQTWTSYNKGTVHLWRRGRYTAKHKPLKQKMQAWRRSSSRKKEFQTLQTHFHFFRHTLKKELKNLKEKISEENELSHRRMSKKIKLNKESQLKSSGNRKQFTFNENLIHNLEEALRVVKTEKYDGA